MEAWKSHYLTGNHHPALEFALECPEQFALDSLHLIDHNGVNSVLQGSALWEIVHDHELPGCRSQDAGCRLLTTYMMC